MVRAARPEEEGIRMVSRDWTTYIMEVNTAVGTPASRVTRLLRMVSMIMPPSATTRMPRAIPMMTAA